jgi:hypothetical protein
MAAMFRAGSLATVLSIGVAAQAQDPDGHVLLLRDGAGNAVEGAQAIAFARGVGEPVVLRDVALRGADGPEFALPRRQLLTGTSDARGVLRLRQEGTPAPGTAASGWVWTDRGLGALLVDVQPGRAQKVVMAPMAAIRTATASETLTVFARAVLQDGRSATFRPPPAAIVRLPAGEYELWIHGADGWLWRRCTLASGQQTQVDFVGPAVRVAPRANLFHPVGRPDVRLGRVDERGVTLLGDARLAAFGAWRGEEYVGPAQLPTEPGSDMVLWPTRNAAKSVMLYPVPKGEEHVFMAVFSMGRHADGSWQLLGASAPRGSRSAMGVELPPLWFDLPRRPDGDVWLLFVAAGHAPQARPWTGTPIATEFTDAAMEFPFTLERGVPLAVIARDETGLPVENLLVEYAPTDMDPAAVEGRSDARGTARLGPVLAPGTLRVVDPRFANQAIELAAIPTDGVAVIVAAGHELRGTAKWSDGAVAANVLVTLRDPSGVLRPPQRAVTADAAGAFVFQGLPTERPLVLFATAQRGGRTWSGKLVGLRAGADEPIELILRDEDPQLLPPAK